MTDYEEMAIDDLLRLVDHACEKYPHFESPRGQRDIAQALSAIKLLSKGFTNETSNIPTCSGKVST